MKTMTREQLLDNLANHGYPLLMPEANRVEEVLENLLEQNDYRLLEGFSVVFLNALQNNNVLLWENDDWSFGNLSAKARVRLPHFLALSELLFKRYPAGEMYVSRTLKLLHKFPNGKEVYLKVSEEVEKAAAIKVNDMEFSFDRLKNNFETYVVHSSGKPEVEQKKSVYARELLLAQFFTPRQKTLLKKKREGDSLNKTEKEYYSRVVKKRLAALANNDLHEWVRAFVAK